MKIYYNCGNEEFGLEDFVEHILEKELLIKPGKIKSLKILERKFLSNKGHALDGYILTKNGVSYGLNIGQNPIGEGYKNYIPFLNDMNCFKVGHIYMINSLIEREIIYLEKQNNSGVSNTLKGYIAPSTFFKEEELVLEIKKQLKKEK